MTKYNLIDCGSTTVRYNHNHIVETFDTVEEAIGHGKRIVQEEFEENEFYLYGEGARHEYCVEARDEDDNYIADECVDRLEFKL